ncbi:hypothetical protein [Dapis sp. BLCC M229]
MLLELWLSLGVGCVFANEKRQHDTPKVNGGELMKCNTTYYTMYYWTIDE